jgi:erythromycin esterase
MGFDVLAFESGMFGCRRAWDALREGGDATAAAGKGVFPIWTQSAQCKELWRYLAGQAKGGQPLELCGFDCQITGSAAGELPDALLGVAGAAGLDDAARQELGKVVRALADGKLPDGMDADACRAALKALEQKLDPRRGIEDAPFWQQLARSLRGYVDACAKPGDGAPLPQQFNPRDAQMGENLVWLAQQRYPRRKLIVWAATMHAARNVDRIATNREDLDYEGVRTMGHGAGEKLGKDLYVVGFVAHAGRAGLPWGRPWEVPPAPKGSFEALCVAAGLQNAWVPLRGTTRPAALAGAFVARPLGHSLMTAPWDQVVDAFVFTAAMQPSTRAVSEAEEADAPRGPAELVEKLTGDLARAKERLAQGNPWADKATFAGTVEEWRRVRAPGRDEIEAAARAVAGWAGRDQDDFQLQWRAEQALALLDAARGDRKAARGHLERAMQQYPLRQLPDPMVHGAFQHLANEYALLLWDDDGFDAARKWALELLAKEPRMQYFHATPWLERIAAAADKERFLVEVHDAYERRKQALPAEAQRITGYQRKVKDHPR